MGEKKKRKKKGVGGAERAEERGGEQERYALLEDWERKTTGRTEGGRERERGVEKWGGRGRIRAPWRQRFPVRGGNDSGVCVCVCVCVCVLHPGGHPLCVCVSVQFHT